MSPLKAAAAATSIPVESIPAGGAAGAALAPNQEAELRATALVLDAGERLCFVSCDTLVVPADVLAEATKRIVAEANVPFANLLVYATHTQHAPCTLDILGCKRDAAFCDRLLEAIVRSAVEASRALDRGGPEEVGAELLFAESQEATVGTNSRYLLEEGTIAWHAYAWDDVVRPTGPFDPDLPVLAVRRPGGELASVLFNHSVHNIGGLTAGMWSPAFYGLAAQELERRHGAATLFLPGAFGSSHNTGAFGSTPNIHAVSTAECVHRVAAAVEQGLRDARSLRHDAATTEQLPFVYRLREFDGAAQEAAVKYWTEKYTPESAQQTQQVFRDMRAEMAPVQGEERRTRLQVIRLGEVALVGVPGELFARLGLEIRRRSPFRYTYVIGLANDTIGYIGDRDSYALGGYQLWAGTHSPSAPGPGEALVEQALERLRAL